MVSTVSSTSYSSSPIVTSNSLPIAMINSNESKESNPNPSPNNGSLSVISSGNTSRSKRSMIHSFTCKSYVFSEIIFKLLLIYTLIYI